MSITIEKTSYEEADARVRNSNRTESPIDVALSSFLRSDSQDQDCRAWFENCSIYWSIVLRTGLFVVQSVYEWELRCQTQDNALKTITADYENAAKEVLQVILHKYPTKKELSEAMAVGIPELVDFRQRSHQFEIQADNIRQKAIQEIKQAKWDRDSASLHDRYPPRGSGCLLIVLGGLFVVTSSLAMILS